MSSLRDRTRDLQAWLAANYRICRIRWLMGKGRGAEAVAVLQQLDLPGSLGHRDKRLESQFARWGPYLRRGSVAPLGWGRLLLALVKTAVAVAFFIFMARFIFRPQPPAASPEPPPKQAEQQEPTQSFRLKTGKAVQVTVPQRVQERQGKLYLETLSESSKGRKEVPFAGFQGGKKTVGDLSIRRFFLARGESIYFVWRGRRAAEGHWVSEQLYSLLQIGRSTPPPRRRVSPPAPPPAPAESAWRSIPDVGRVPVAAGILVRKVPGKAAHGLLEIDAEGELPLSGHGFVAGKSLWLGVVLAAPDGRITQGFIEGKLSLASVALADDGSTGILTHEREGTRRFRETPNGKRVASLAKGDRVVLSGAVRWDSNNILWLKGQVTIRNSESKEGWIGYEFKPQQSTETP